MQDEQKDSTNINQLILGDCLEVLQKIETASIDLIYLDPPFFSNRNYEIIWGDEGETRSFEDRWSGGIDHYISWLKERVQEMYRVLKPTGSIFLHCDWHANAYIRVFILDKIFGENNFRNEIVWKRKTGRGETNRKSKRFGACTDTIFFYSKSDKNLFHSQFSFEAEGYSEYVDRFFKFVDEKGRRYRLADLSSPNPRPNLMYEYRGYKPPKNGWAISREKMEQWDNEGRLHFPKTSRGRIQRKRYLDELKGKPIQNLWDDIELSAQSSERIGYPTQKPEALLERIILAASNEGDVVLDPFVGGGTTIAVADRLKRRWIGIDQSVAAIKVSDLRITKQTSFFSEPFVVQLHTYAYETLRYQEAFAFESWIIEQYGGVANVRQRGDLGMDGRTEAGKPIQVKRSDNVGRNVVDNFKSACERYDKTLFDQNKANGEMVGIIIAFSFGRGAVQEVARLKNQENVIIQLVTVEEIVPTSKRPSLNVTFKDLGLNSKQLREIAFEATGTSNAGIEFYAWDWEYDVKNGVFKPTILRDKDGKQTRGFASGTHCIAVKVVDHDGLENLEIITLKVNGVILQAA